MVIVSLGSNCAVAYQLDKLNLRDQAYPFDWAKIKLDSLIQVLESGFVDFTDMFVCFFSNKHFTLDQITQSTNSDGEKILGSYIVSNKYNIKFAHEITNTFGLKKFIDQQKRRITRFTNLSNPTFVRLETGNVPKSYQTKYEKLSGILLGLFPEFKLIVISNNKISGDRIIWYKLEEFDKDWTYSKLNWKSIFTICDTTNPSIVKN